MFYELLTFSCTVASVILSIVKCSKETLLNPAGKTTTISKLKEDTPSVKKANEKKATDGKSTNDKEINNNQKSINTSASDNFKRPEDQSKFAKRKDPNYMTLNNILDDCFEKNGEKLTDSPTKNDKKSSVSVKEVAKKTTDPDIPLPQKPKNCGIAGSSDPQYQTLNFFSDACFEKKE